LTPRTRKPEWSESLEILAAMNIGAGDSLTTEFEYHSVSKDSFTRPTILRTEKAAEGGRLSA